MSLIRLAGGFFPAATMPAATSTAGALRFFYQDRTTWPRLAAPASPFLCLKVGGVAEDSADIDDIWHLLAASPRTAGAVRLSVPLGDNPVAFLFMSSRDSTQRSNYGCVLGSNRKRRCCWWEAALLKSSHGGGGGKISFAAGPRVFHPAPISPPASSSTRNLQRAAHCWHYAHFPYCVA